MGKKPLANPVVSSIELGVVRLCDESSSPEAAKTPANVENGLQAAERMLLGYTIDDLFVNQPVKCNL